jgi:hypothetical protein
VYYKHRHVYFKPGRRHINPRQLCRDFRRHRIYEKAKAEYLVLSSQSLVSCDFRETVDFINSLNYDMLIAGADTILQLLDYHRRDGSVPVYWLPPELNGIRVMCGSSCRVLSRDELTEQQQAKMKECINTMPLLGVRDQATYDLILAIGLDDPSKLTQIPDPTFSLKIDYARAEAFIRRRNLGFSIPSVLISLPDSYKPTRQLVSYYRSRGYRIVSFGYAPYADINLPDISPFEWAGLYKYFDAVITDRFHGTLFSIRNNTPVVSIVCRSDLMDTDGNSKYASLWRLFGLEQTNWINGITCTDADAVLEKINTGIETFKSHSSQRKLEELKTEYVDFVDRVAGLLE